MIVEGWYKRRNYPHFDREVSERVAARLVTNPQEIARHSFYPFIRRELKAPRYQRQNDGQGGTTGKVSSKRRRVCFAAHLDAHIYSYYSKLLCQHYEEWLETHDIAETPTAYRRLLDHGKAECGRKSKARGKTSIHFAKEVFDFILSQEACIVIALDVERFFDNIDHALLKQAWMEVLGVERLEPDHYAVFRSITRYAYVNERRLRKVPACQEFLRLPRKDQAGRRICTPREFRNQVRGNGHVLKTRIRKGIPQGSPISPMLSNIYMAPFDERVRAALREVGGLYRRYSDDMILICSVDDAEGIEARVMDLVGWRNLSINESKTERVKFARICEGVYEWEREEGVNRPLQYLGFEFDGEHIRIRASSTTRYNRRMRRAVRRTAKEAEHALAHGQSGKIRKRKLYERFNHLGRRTFVSYANRASHIMLDDAIRGQMKRHQEALNQEIKRCQPRGREVSDSLP